MRWYDYGMILCALILALWADYDAGVAFRASVVNYLVIFGSEWVRAYDLRRTFGPSVYKHLHKLVEEGIIERREALGGPERGRRSDFFYRWKEPTP